MNLYIRIENGQPVNHPIAETNLNSVVRGIDVDNLPSDYASFTRVEMPELGPYEVCTSTYQWGGDIVTDAHSTREMTTEEKTAKQDAVKADWAASGYASWVFNEDDCTFYPPTPRPLDGIAREWDEETISWVEVASNE
jgi:hypothetical protein